MLLTSSVDSVKNQLYCIWIRIFDCDDTSRGFLERSEDMSMNVGCSSRVESEPHLKGAIQGNTKPPISAAQNRFVSGPFHIATYDCAVGHVVTVKKSR